MNVPSLSSFARAASAAALLLARRRAAAHAQSIRFTPCPENAALDCGTLEVPVDYDCSTASTSASRSCARGPPTPRSASACSSCTRAATRPASTSS